MEITKSSLTVDGQSVHMSMPFAKVDVNKRTVSGYATLDNIDSQGDIVTSEASRKAFGRARGNLREMHDKVAVGRVVDFKEQEFYDSETNKFYTGIFVTAYISEGAESTWLKVLDGTLSGFSIGGEVNDSSTEFVKDANRTVRFVTDYDLVELSLVDNPANQLANVFSIQKSAGGSVNVEGMLADTEVENVFLCETDRSVVSKATEEESCPMCGTRMRNIGWLETGPDRTDKVRNIVDKFLQPSETEAAPVSEGGVEMAKNEEENVKTTEDAQETPDAVDATADDAEEQADPNPHELVDESEETEEGDDVEEVADDEDVISKMIDELKGTIHESLEKNKTETAEQIKTLEGKIDEVNKFVTQKASELESKFSEFGKELTAAKTRVGELEKSLDTVNKSTAVKKSADVESAEQPVQKSNTVKWGSGTFSGETLFK